MVDLKPNDFEKSVKEFDTGQDTLQGRVMGSCNTLWEENKGLTNYS